MQRSGRTRIQLCGRLVVELDGRRLEGALPARQGKLLFAYLVLNDERVVRRDELVDCLWPVHPPADPAAALTTVISRLRRVLGPGVVEGRSELSLVLPSDAEVDVRVAADAIARARAAVSAHDWQAAWGPAHAALAITRRGLLPGLEARWLEPHRRELEEVGLEALELVAETGLGLGGSELAAAERAASALVARAPFRESGHGLRMRLLAARGDVAEALQAYEELRKLLREELGTSPSAALVELHRRLLDGKAPATDRPRGAEASPGASSDFVGRSRELALLERALEDAARRRRGVVLIGGEPGIGKTRLAEELAAGAGAAAVEVAWGRCHDGPGAPPFWPWVQVIRTISGRRAPEQVRRALGTGAPELAQVVPELGVVSGAEPVPLLDPEAARFRLYDSIAQFLARITSSRTLLLVLDDLQWADEPSLDVLRFLAARRDEARMLIVGTYRTTEATDTGPFAKAAAALAEEPHVTRLELVGLAGAELAALVERATGVDAGERLVAVLHGRTGGNPFYASQLVRLLEADGDRAGRAAEDIVRLGVPGGVRDVIRHRVGRLTAETGALLTRAAVVGEEFELEVVARVAGLDTERALDLLESAVAHAVVAESETGVGRFRFSHALVREALYAELSAVRRSRLHREVADVLEGLHGGDGERVVELAHHLYEAAPTGVAAEACTYAVRAAEHALSRLAYEQAEQQLRRALELVVLGPSGAERAERELDVQLRISTLLMMTRGYAAPEVGEACARACELAREVGDERQLLSALWRLAVFHEVRAEFGPSGDIGEELLELAARTDRPAYLLAGKQILGVIALHGGRPASARDDLVEARDLADRLDGLAAVFGMDFRVTSRAFLAWAHALLGDGHSGELAAEALALARRVSGAHDEAYALFIAACCAVLRRDLDDAERRADEGVALCSGLGFRLFGAMTAIVRGWALGMRERPAAAVDEMKAGLAALESTGARMMLPFFQALLAEVLWRSGRLEDALAAATDGLSRVDPTSRFYESELHRLTGEITIALDPRRAEEAERSLRKAVAVAREQGARGLEELAVTGVRGAARR